jgi:hypothetical protein
MQTDKWIIDGVGPLPQLWERMNQADLIIVVDLPIWRHFYWATKRQVKSIFQPRHDLPANCQMWRKSFVLYQLIWNFHYHIRQQILCKVTELKNTKFIIFLKSPKEIKNFLKIIFS